jgi:hypothetical protein
MSSIIALSAIVMAFLLFAVVLAWGEYQTRNIAKAAAKNEQSAFRQQKQNHPATERKAPSLINS